MKRFTDTAIWDKAWFMRLSAEEKCAFQYILAKCDCIGVLDINEILLSACAGFAGDIDDLLKKTNGNLERLGSTKLWISDFCKFQYGKLSEKCKPHKKYIQELKSRGLFERVSKGYPKGINTLQEKEQEEEEEKEEEKEEGVQGGESQKWTPCKLALSALQKAIAARYRVSTPDMAGYVSVLRDKESKGVAQFDIERLCGWLGGLREFDKFLAQFGNPGSFAKGWDSLMARMISETPVEMTDEEKEQRRRDCAAF